MKCSALASLARRVQAALREMNYASRRVTALRLFVGLQRSGRAPDAYAEFLPARRPPHELPARCR